MEGRQASLVPEAATPEHTPAGVRAQTAESPVHALFRTQGNQASARFIQAKLQVNPPGDQYEEEADRVADAVMRKETASARGIDDIGPEATVQRQVDGPEEERDASIQRQEDDTAEPDRGESEEEDLEAIQTKSAGGGVPLVTPDVEDRLASSAGGGSTMPDDLRGQMEDGIGHDFSDTRIHAGADAHRLTSDLQARAFTHGNDIYFGAGEYAPESAAGRRLLAHELAHTVQQGGSLRRVQRFASHATPAAPARRLASRVGGECPIRVGPGLDDSNPDRAPVLPRVGLAVASPPPPPSPGATAGDDAAAALFGGATGTPLSRSLRRSFEVPFGESLDDVRIHVDETAAAAAARFNARAFTAGRHIGFAEGAYAPGTSDGRRLLGHELTHVVQQRQGDVPLAVQCQHGPPRSRRPFEGLLEAQASASTMLAELVTDLAAIASPSAELTAKIAELREFTANFERKGRRLSTLIDVYAAGEDVELSPLVEMDPLDYVTRGRPNVPGVARHEATLRDLVTMLALVRGRVAALGEQVALFGPDVADFVRDAFHTLIAYHLDLIANPNAAAFRSLAFLATYYQDPGFVATYGIVRHIAAETPVLYRNLRQASGQGRLLSETLAPDARPIDTEFERQHVPALPRYTWEAGRQATVDRCYNRLVEFQRTGRVVGALPRSVEDVSAQEIPSRPGTASILAADLFQTQVEIAVLNLWQPVDALYGLVYSHNAIGTTLNPLVGNQQQDRHVWLRELSTLEQAFDEEVSGRDHPDIQSKIDDWERRVTHLITVIPPEARFRHITTAILEQLPFLFVSGGAVLRIGVWVGRVTRGSRWLMALAEGAAMTAFTALGVPQGAGRPQSAGGWAAHFALNVGWARVGRILFEAAGNIGERIANSRQLLAQLSIRVVAPGVTLATLQTAAQTIEAAARGRGGETSFSELLTINLILHGLGMFVGFATQPSAPSTWGTGLQRVSAADLARRMSISEADARVLLEVAARFDEFSSRVGEVQGQARRGTLTEAEFQALKQQALDLADYFEPRLGAVRRAQGLPFEPADAAAAMAQFRARISAMTWSARPEITLMLPQHVEGLRPVGEGTTWTYPADRPPRQLPALRRSFADRGYGLRELPGGGWAALGPGNRLALQVVPIRQATAAILPPTLSEIASGPQAAAGLARVQSQTGVPVQYLESLLTAAAARNQHAVVRILRSVGRFLEPTNTAAWNGLKRCLELGIDPALIARASSYGRSRENAVESEALANRFFGLAAGWGPEAADGFAALYRLRPGLTAERLHSLLGNFEPLQVKGILESLAALEPRSRNLRALIGPLTGEGVSNQRGGMGALTAAVQAAEQHPNAIVVLEQPQVSATGEITRIIDIVLIEQQTVRVAGQTRTTEVELLALEIKEVARAAFGRRGRQELARDIARDSRLRAQRLTPVGASRPFFETFIWRVRRVDIAAEAAGRLGIADAADPRVEVEMRRMVEADLRPALQRPEFTALPADERTGYERAFAGVPFVQFF